MIARILQCLLAAQLLFAWWVGFVLTTRFGWPSVLAVLVCLAIIPAGHAVAIGQHFLFSRWAGSPAPHDPAVPPVGMVSVYLRELRDSFIAFNLRQPFFGNRSLPSAPGAGSRNVLPVLFLHGYFCNRAVWRPLAQWLAARGHVTGSVNLEPAFGSIDAYAPLIDAAVRELQQRTGFEQIALVCHSMGGLAARAYLRACGDDGIAKVITLGTPHRGTYLAWLGLGRNVRQMRLDSDWLQALAQSETAGTRRHFTVIFSHDDNVVVPQAFQTLPDAEIIEFSGLGHLTLAMDQQVWEAVESRLVQ